MARDEQIFLFILLVNLIVALIYLLVGSLVVVSAHSVVRDKKAEPEILYDNRRTYLLRFLVMLLCPVIGPLYFFLGYLLYLFVFWRDVNLADVIFSKERVRTRRKADEELERNIIPLEEAILVNEKKDLRRTMMNVLKADIQDSLSSILLALDSEDSETSHYAATALSGELNKFRQSVQRLWQQMQEEDPDETACEETLLDSMDTILHQRVFSEHEQRKFVGIFAQAAESLYYKKSDRLTPRHCEAVCLRALELKDFACCERWCRRMDERFPEELAAYTCRLKMYFARQDREAFYETLEALKHSSVVIDQQTLELIRIFG